MSPTVSLSPHLQNGPTLIPAFSGLLSEHPWKLTPNTAPLVPLGPQQLPPSALAMPALRSPGEWPPLLRDLTWEKAGPPPSLPLASCPSGGLCLPLHSRDPLKCISDCPGFPALPSKIPLE